MRSVSEAIRKGEVHVGQELLVAAFFCNDEKDYGAKPVLILPTCKRGSFEDAAMLLEQLRQAWHLSPYGEAMHGPIWSIASDGDPKRRPALFLHCMTRELTPADSLYEHVGFLPGLSLMTGPKLETQDLNYKHNFKRICKLVCTTGGILVFDSAINKIMIPGWLGRLTTVDLSRNSIFHLINPTRTSAQQIEALVNPKDPQDVPRAIKLLSLLGELKDLDRDDMNPSELRTHNSLALLGEMLTSLLEPFINPDFTLSEQVASLSKFAFIPCGLFRKHGSDFMPQHLYSDLQCMVRTAIFRVAHTKILDPTHRVLLCLLGDDVLEVLLGCVRMIGGHAPNVGPDVFVQRTAAAVRLRKIFEIYPHWERRARRLLLKRARDANHLSPRNWRGELSAASCDLQGCWVEGMNQAMEALRKHAGHNIDFGKHFANGRQQGVDLVRPNGGKYPGISAGVDSTIWDNTTNTESPPSVDDLDLASPGYYPFRDYDGQSVLDAPSAVRTGFVDAWMELEPGKKVHKYTILRYFTDPCAELDYKKSHDRLIRVRAFSGSIGGSNCTSWSDEQRDESNLAQHLPNSCILSIESIYATILSTDGQGVSLCVMRCTSIKHKSQSLESTPISEVTLTGSAYNIGGQIMELLPFTDNSDLENGASSFSWPWTSGFISLEKVKKTTSLKTVSSTAARLPNLNFVVNGRLVFPLVSGEASPVAVDMDELSKSEHAPHLLDKFSQFSTTWSITDHALQTAQKVLVERCRSEEITLKHIPVTEPVRTGCFPYTRALNLSEMSFTEDGQVAYYTTAVHPVENGPLPCSICQKQIEPGGRQNHMGRHILAAKCGVPPCPSNIGAVSDILPCGFCGQSMANGACKVSIGKRRGNVISSTCKYAHELQIAAASRSTDSRPSSNVPIACRLSNCGEVHWKYNIMRRIEDRHPNHPAQPMADPAFKESMAIPLEELRRMGYEDTGSQLGIRRVTEAHDMRRSGRSPTIRDGHCDSPRRPRHYTTPSGLSEIGGMGLKRLVYHSSAAHLIPSSHLKPSLDSQLTRSDVFSL